MVATALRPERVSATWQPALRRCFADIGRFWFIAYFVAVAYLQIRGVFASEAGPSLDWLLGWMLEAWLLPLVAAWWMLTTPLFVVPLTSVAWFLLLHGLGVLWARAAPPR